MFTVFGHPVFGPVSCFCHQVHLPRATSRGGEVGGDVLASLINYQGHFYSKRPNLCGFNSGKRIIQRFDFFLACEPVKPTT
jgi:hypothetical protein